jgi:hypothetical protein
LKLEKNEVRNAVKHEIWKAMLGGLIRKGLLKCRQILKYNIFGSTRKKKKKNHMMQLSDKTINELYELGTIGFKQRE